MSTRQPTQDSTDSIRSAINKMNARKDFNEIQYTTAVALQTVHSANTAYMTIFGGDNTRKGYVRTLTCFTFVSTTTSLCRGTKTVFSTAMLWKGTSNLVTIFLESRG